MTLKNKNIGSIQSSFGRRCTAGRAAPLLAAMLLAGCSIGPLALKENHIGYNQAVRQVVNEELLLNIVRMRYGDPTQYLSVASITSQLTLGGSFSGNVDVAPTITSGSALLGIDYADSPTLSLVPRTGEEVAEQLLSPINVRNLAYIATLGFGPRTVLGLLTSNINGIRGIEMRLDANWKGEESELFRVVDLIAELGNEIDIGFVRVFDPYMPLSVKSEALKPTDLVAAVQTNSHWRSKDGGTTYNLTREDSTPVVWISEKGKASPAGRALMSLLSLDPAAPFYRIVRTESLNRPTKLLDRLFVETRSFQAVLQAVSLGVEAPADDLENGSIERIGDQSSGTQFREALHRRFSIQSSDSSPDHAAVAVQYRDHWFYIDDHDHAAKTSFTLIANLFDLQVKGPSKDSEPVLTLPVGG